MQGRGTRQVDRERIWDRGRKFEVTLRRKFEVPKFVVTLERFGQNEKLTLT